MTEIILRDYQAECVEAVRREWDAGHLSTLAVLSTGAGKTEIALATLAAEQAAGRLQRVLFLVHTIELVTQPLERIDRAWPEFFGMTGIVQADHNDVDRPFVMATWQSLSRGRLDNLLAFGPITHLVLDECHRSVAQGISAIVKRLQAENKTLRVLGLTATPVRSDRAGLAKMFDSVAYKFPINRAIRAGALVPFSALGVELPDADLSQVKETADGWDADELGAVLSAENVKELVYQNWSEYCQDRLTIGFTASVAQAERMADYFSARGVRAAMVSGETPRDVRRQRISDFRAGRLQVLFNVFVLVEGFDAPETSAVMMIAPTRSDLVYTQRLGRGLRLFPGKSDCVVLDFAPAKGGRNIIMAGDVLGMPREVKKAQEKAERQGILFSIQFDALGQSRTIDPAELVVKVLDLLGRHHLAWVVDNQSAVASIGKDASLLIELPQPERAAKAEALKAGGQWSAAWDSAYRAVTSYGLWLIEGKYARFQGYFETMDAAKDKGDLIAEQAADAAAVLREKDSSWRRLPASDKQIAMLQRLGVPFPEACRKGQAAQLITGALAWRAVQSAKGARVYA